MEQMDDVIRGRLKGALIIKKADYTVVMRSVIWAQGWWFVGDPLLSGLLQQSLEDFSLRRVVLVDATQGYDPPEGVG